MELISLISANDWARFWFYVIGINVIPAISKKKIPLVEWKEDSRGNWQEVSIPDEIFEEWVRQDKFRDGLAGICGKVFRGEHKGKWLNGIDCDNKLAIDEVCPSGIRKVAEITIVEQHSNKDKCHIYFYTKEPIQSQAPLEGDNIPKIEIKSGGNLLLYCSGGIHKDGSLIDIIGVDKIKTVDKIGLENRLDDIFKKYNIEYLTKKELTGYKKPVYEVSKKLHEGSNRGVHILSYLESKLFKNPELNDDDLFYFARKYEKENCVDVYDNKKINELVKEARPFVAKKLVEKEEKKSEIETNKKRPLQQIEEYLNTQIKEDKTIVSQILRIYLSAYTDNPINMALLAPSSDGKTYATVKVADLFPKNDIIKIGRISPTSLIHQNGFWIDDNGNQIQSSIDALDKKIAEARGDERTEFEQQKKDLMRNARKCVDLKNKILLFLDNPNPQVYEMLKPIMSHDSKEIEYMTTKGDGSLNVKKSIIRNWPVFIFCSAKNEEKNEVWEEIKTRVFVSSPNNSIEKYAAANKLTSKKFSRPTWGRGIYENEDDKRTAQINIEEMKKKLIDFCKDDNNPIINPFDEIIDKNFPHTQGISMRHFTRLLSFINLETLLNVEYNPEMVFETKDGKIIKSVFTTINDIDSACRVLKNISTIPPEKINFIDQVFKPRFKEELNCEGLASDKLAEKYTQVFKKPITTKQVLENYLRPLRDAGILSSEPNPDNVSQQLFKEASTVTIHNLSDLKSKLIEASKLDSSYIVSCLKELDEVSIETRKSKAFFRINNIVIDLDELGKILLGDSGNQSKPNEEKS